MSLCFVHLMLIIISLEAFGGLNHTYDDDDVADSDDAGPSDLTDQGVCLTLLSWARWSSVITVGTIITIRGRGLYSANLMLICMLKLC